MSEITENIPYGSDTFQCTICGAPVKYNPGTDFLHCDYCGTDIPIDSKIVEEIEELDFEKYAQNIESIDSNTAKVIACRKCGAESTFEENLKSDLCPYCNTPFIESDIHEERLIKPSYLLPFKVDDSHLRRHAIEWINSLWFAPNKLKKRALLSTQLQGVYIPCWTYDAHTETIYRGERGVTYMTTVGTGKNRRTVTQTRWSYCNGTVFLFFDDILVPASKMIPTNIMNKIYGWDTKNLVEADIRFLTGFTTEKYILNLTDGYKYAKKRMESDIDSAIRRDIGGNSQRIHSKKTKFSDIKFKLILLPVYISSYTYNNRLYHFYMNGRTGLTTGDRPYSLAKITFSVTLGIIAFILLAMFLSSQ